MRLEAAQFRELAAFAQFGSDLDAETKKKLERGRRLMEILKQDQYAPLSMAEQVVAFFALTTGFLDETPVDDILSLEKKLLSYVRDSHESLLAEIAKKGDWNEELGQRLTAAIKDFMTAMAIG